MNWKGIINTASRIVTVAKKDLGAIGTEIGKDAMIGVRLFIKCEPVAITALTPFCPVGAAIVRAAYVIAQKIEEDVDKPGATKLTIAKGILSDAVLPGIEASIAASGHTIDAAVVSASADDLFSAIVAENNAQSKVMSILRDAAASGQAPSATDLAAAEHAVAEAVATVKTLGLSIQAAVKSIQPLTQAA